MRRPSLGELALSAASLAVGLGGLELAARLARAGDAGEPVASLYTEPDPLLGWRHRPGARVAFPNGDYAINSLGLRDLERGYQPRVGHGRVLLLGDSFAEGFSVSFEDAVPQRLERELAGAGCRYEVIGAGTVGWSTDQELLFFREEGWRYRPEVVVLLLYVNDVLQNGRGSVGRAPKPLFSFSGGVARLSNVPLPAPEPEPAGAGSPAPARGSAALSWLRERLARGQPEAHDLLAGLGLWPRLEREAPGEELQVYARQPPRAVDDAWAFTVHLLRELAGLVEARGGRLLVGYVPAKHEVVDRDWRLTQRRHGIDDSGYDRRSLARRLAEACAGLGVPFVDLSPALAAEERGWLGGPYHAGGGHWNALGHRVAARELSHALQQGGLRRCSGGAGE